MLEIIRSIAQELSLRDFQVHNTVELLFNEECTIPFVARYRKERTGSLDEEKIREIRDRYTYVSELEASKDKYLKVVNEHCVRRPELTGKFPELERKFRACKTKQELEDLYLPFKPKRRTRAQIAKEKGLEALAELIFNSERAINDLNEVALKFVTLEKSDLPAELRVKTPEEALVGAGDILAERISETAAFRSMVRAISHESGKVVAKKIDGVDEPKASAPEIKGSLPGKKSKSKGKDKEDKVAKYRNYFEYSEPLATCPAHRVMAVRRGEAEKILRVNIAVDEDRIIRELQAAALGEKVRSDAVKLWLQGVIADAYRRLLNPSIETELRLELKSRAEDEAIRVFAKNLERLLLLPPIPKTVVMGVDPGFRTGSKLAVVSETGKALAHQTIYPQHDREDAPKTIEAKKEILNLIKTHKVNYIAIGNGTGSREMNKLIVSVIKENEIKDVKKLFVNEAGASVYSTDEIAREEFPDLDPTIRSAISIARRLQDPLAELVKIDPRSIGVGQYQHDVNVNKLKSSLEEVVESCVNRVGVNLNTASVPLLSYVSGIGPNLAKSIVSFRDKSGEFKSRQQLTDISGFGARAFTLAAGFLRVPSADNPLDNSAVHPESYELVSQIAKDLKKPLDEIIGNQNIVQSIPLERYVTATVGMPTLLDIARELIKPGRDPREDGSRLHYSDDIAEITDLRIGMELQGSVTNVTNFGAFVDIGVHQDGLVHISELSDQFVTDPSKIIAVGDVVKVRVIEVDVDRKRISLSCRSERPPQAQTPSPRERRDARPTTGSSKPRKFDSQQPQPTQHRGPRNRPNQGDQQQRNHNQPRDGFSTNKRRHSSAPAASNFTIDDLMKKFNRNP